MQLDFMLVAVCLLLETASAIKGKPPFKREEKKHGKHHKHGEHSAQNDLNKFKLDIHLYKAAGVPSLSEGTKGKGIPQPPIRPTGFGVLVKILFSGTYAQCNELQVLVCPEQLAICPSLTCATMNQSKDKKECNPITACNTLLYCDCDNLRGYYKKSDNEDECLTQEQCNAIYPKGKAKRKHKNKKKKV